MRSPRRHVALALVLGVVLGAGAARPAAAGVPSEQLRAQIDRVLKVLDDPELKKDGKSRDRRVAVRKIANDIFDFGETARRSLGRHWQARSPAERDEFVQLFSDLLERSYISRVELYGGEKIQYLGDTVDADQAKVQTKLLTKSASEIPIEYRMHRKGGGGERWLVYDVIIEGVSLVANYRTQFNKIIQTSSYQELVRKMKTKQEEMATGQPS
jgi:phospholipid transport system substrate-binding protein